MNILFVADPLEVFKIYKDTTFSMMREAQRRGHRIAACGPQDLVWQSGDVVKAAVREITLTGEADAWFRETASPIKALKDFDAVVMRKDPPFDSEYFYATHLLEQAEREGARVFNKPAALRDHPEKLAVMEFAQFTSPTLVTRDADAVRALPRRAPGHHPQAARRHGRHGHLPREGRWPEPGLHHRDAQQERRADHHGAALRARDRAGRQAHPGDRRQAGALQPGAHPAGHARCAATWRPAARAWPSR